LVRYSLFGLLYQLRMMGDDECTAVGGKIGKETRSTRRELASAALCPPRIPRDLTRARTRTETVGSRRLSAWVMARPFSNVTVHSLTSKANEVCGTMLNVYWRQ
jgi:hypothetical protein